MHSDSTTILPDCHKGRTAEQDLREVVRMMKQCQVLGMIPPEVLPALVVRLETIAESLEKRTKQSKDDPRKHRPVVDLLQAASQVPYLLEHYPADSARLEDYATELQDECNCEPR